jgi:hypothetical protein
MRRSISLTAPGIHSAYRRRCNALADFSLAGRRPIASWISVIVLISIFLRIVASKDCFDETPLQRTRSAGQAFEPTQLFV